MARRETLANCLGKVLDQTGYLQDLREDRTEESQARLTTSWSLSAAREFEGHDDEALPGGFVDRLSLLSEVDEEQGRSRRASG